MFLANVLGALQIDSFEGAASRADFKRAFTPDAVRAIYGSISQGWPGLEDYERVLKAEGGVTALYTGSYEPEDVFRAISRHSLYSEKIYLVDPFWNPAGMREEFNPLLHPDQHRANAIKFTHLWLTLFPWIDAGLVGFIRPLSDFVPGLFEETLRIQRARFEANPELEAVLEEQAKSVTAKLSPTDGGIKEHFVLSHPDEFFRDMFKQFPSDNPFRTEEEFIRYIQARRDEHPYFVERLPGQIAEFHHHTSGANYELAKRICSISNSHIITDLRSRWKEVEIDRKNAGIDENGWSPFAKALQATELSVLSNIPLQAALRLRSENRLEAMRLFFRKLWLKCREPDTFSESNAVSLASELQERIAESRDEWSKIDQDLLKWLGATSGAVVTAGLIGFVPAASAGVVTGVTSLIQAQMKRTSFNNRYPAGFFIDLDRRNRI